MIRNDHARVDPKRRQVINPKTRQFVKPAYGEQDYKHRLNFYAIPPTAEVTLEEFELWAIDRLKVLAELEACSFRNKSQDETESYMRPILEKYLPLSQNTARSPSQQQERKKDHYSHFILRLAFSATEDLRRRFARLETSLFRMRFLNNESRDRTDFVESLAFDWLRVSPEERAELSAELAAVAPPRRNAVAEEDAWYKVSWTRVPELVESRRVFLKRGFAYVPAREQTSMVVSEFGRRLDSALEQTARALPRLDEDDRLSPILQHLSQNFNAPGSTYTSDSSLDAEMDGNISAGSIDGLSNHFPLCMRNLHIQLRKNSHLKHYGRLQYTLFLKGIGLSLEECLIFWRHSFKLITDDTFNKEYRYNVRHAYGDVGGDANRRGRGYTPYSCQKLLTEPLPGPGQNHGCPYRTYGEDNLISLLEGVGVRDRDVLKGVRDDVKKQRFHIACNRVFEWSHRTEIKKVKDEGTWGPEQLDTIVHPNVYFKRSFLLKSLANKDGPNRDVKMEGT
ncbi:MAG: hypothetical protein Q9162_007937 [Coniocarpon cinnabarinum]